MTEIEKLKKEIEDLKLIIESKNNQVESKNKQKTDGINTAMPSRSGTN